MKIIQWLQNDKEKYQNKKPVPYGYEKLQFLIALKLLR